ncbi:amino acid ABC transporter ATP-binding protein [Paenibacillus sp. chi10]|uniref:Amino acid ABC transporter ATP-binding protein n=1 Tax=Paenibacillus suaedae TaxID=3077233 RepID=A0AAJ2N3I3_9BACL|nr:amino acid ABC transporter ATP-binding protein [Paenibacillus sp. chi10]MDT8976347.1 amino acid ABC transporter ATP-binding protein [Paenibacillus sp. chi10]
MITIDNLHKSYGNTDVLKGINLQIDKGEVIAIIGPSGSGKSTFLRTLNLLEQPQRGTITIDGVQINAEKYTKKEVYQLRQKTAMVFQNYNLFKHKTALANVTESLIVTRKMNKAQAVEIGMKLLHEVGLEGREHHYPAVLSGGQQQRVGIARALALDPYVILFDEPTSSLDPELVEEVLHVIKEVTKKNTTMIIVTHEMDFARNVADRVIFMADGHIIEEGTPEELFLHTQNERTKKFIRNYVNTLNGYSTEYSI